MKGPTTLEFAPLTIFCGKNSSGKSTIIQSILLISQTLSNKVSARPIVLNGALAKLGQIEDIVTFGAANSPIEIGWKCRPLVSHDPMGALPLVVPAPSMRVARGLGAEQPSEVSCNLHFGVPATEGPNRLPYPELVSFDLDATVPAEPGTDESAEVHARIYRIQGGEGSNFWEPDGDGFHEGSAGQAFVFNLESDELTTNEILEDYVSAEIVGCFLRHFLPSRIWLASDPGKEFVEHAIQELLYGRQTRMGRLARYRTRPLPPQFIELVRSSLPVELQSRLFPANQMRLFPEQPYTLESLRIARRRLTDEENAQTRLHLSKQEQLFRTALEVRRVGERETEVASRRLPRSLSSAIDYVDSYFSGSIRYLGPLRDDPKALYPIATTTDPSDVGVRGENTAAVLDLHQRQTVTHVPPSSFADEQIAPGAKRTSLLKATIEWIRYLEIGQSVITNDRGRLGHELRVFPLGSRHPHDLTHVGVGVSQILPILVACLLADEDTVIIIEQPELHLHPKVQARLADFFIAMAMVGKQCILETHSEHVLGRIRWRIAASVENTLEKNVRVYFSEKPGEATEYRPVVINEFGAIANWPVGFFDETQTNAEALLRAAMAKRKRQQGQFP